METFFIRDVPPHDLRREAERALAELRAVVGDAADVLEVGSTAVAGVIGKGDIDLLVRCDAADFARVRALLDAAFARDEQQLSNDVYQGYRVASRHDVAIQFTVRGGPHDLFTDFVDALRGDSDLVERYNALKRAHHGKPMNEYREAKSAFIAAVLARGGND